MPEIRGTTGRRKHTGSKIGIINTNQVKFRPALAHMTPGVPSTMPAEIAGSDRVLNADTGCRT